MEIRAEFTRAVLRWLGAIGVSMATSVGRWLTRKLSPERGAGATRATAVQVRICDRCQSSLGPDGRFCPRCGLAARAAPSWSRAVAVAVAVAVAACAGLMIVGWLAAQRFDAAPARETRHRAELAEAQRQAAEQKARDEQRKNEELAVFYTEMSNQAHRRQSEQGTSPSRKP